MYSFVLSILCVSLLTILYLLRNFKTSNCTNSSVDNLAKTREYTMKNIPRNQQLEELVKKAKEDEHQGYFWLDNDLWITSSELCKEYVKQSSIMKSAIPEGSFARKTVGSAFISSEEKIPLERKQIRSIAPNKNQIESTFEWHKKILFSELSKKLVEQNNVISGDELGSLFMNFALGIVWELVFGIPHKIIELPQTNNRSCLDILLQDCLSLGKYSLDSPECSNALSELHQLAQSVLKESNGNCPLDRLKDLSLPHEQLIDNIKLFILAGAETTSSTLSVICQIIARHPELQCNEIIQKNDKIIDDIIKETLRLYPTAPFFLRTSKQSLNISFGDGKEVVIPSNTNVFAFTWFMQRYDCSWEKSLEFIVDRWKDKNSNQFYEPFGNKQRKCLGERLAVLEMRSVLEDLLCNWNISLDSNNPNEKMDEKCFVIDWCHAVVHLTTPESLLFTQKIK